MRIIGPGGIETSAEVKRKKDKASGSGFGQVLSSAQTEESAPASTVNVPQNISPLNSLMMLQEAEDYQGKNQRIVAQGYTLLDRLEDIRLGLLTGSLSPVLLRQLDTLLQQWKSDYSEDPKLLGLMQEIELRAAVELAKLENS